MPEYFVDSDYIVRELDELSFVSAELDGVVVGYLVPDSGLGLVLCSELYGSLEEAEKAKFEMKLKGVFAGTVISHCRAVINFYNNDWSVWFSPVADSVLGTSAQSLKWVAPHGK